MYMPRLFSLLKSYMITKEEKYSNLEKLYDRHESVIFHLEEAATNSN